MNNVDCSKDVILTIGFLLYPAAWETGWVEREGEGKR